MNTPRTKINQEVKYLELQSKTQNSIATFQAAKIEKQTEKMVEMHNTECNKLDRMIALLEKIAGDWEVNNF